MGYLDNAGLQYLWGKLKEKFAPKSHTHDDRYYTEPEMDGRLSSKVDNNEAGANGLINKLSTADGIPNDATVFISQHNDGKTASYYRRPISTLWTYIKGKADGVYQPKGSYAPAAHTHDDRYYTEAEINSKLDGKSNTGHTHDDRYYTETEIDTKLNGKAPNGHTHQYLSLYGARPANINFTKSTNGTGAMFHFVATSSTTTGKPPDDSSILQLNWDNNGGWDSQLALSTTAKPHVYYRNQQNGTWGNWSTLLDNLNYIDYAAKKEHTHTKAQITDFPASLKNPTALTIQTNGAIAATYDGSAAKTVNITKGNIGLGNVDNTADANKSVKYATSAGNASSATKATSADSAGKLTMGDAQTALSGTTSPTAGLTVNKVYNNGYPTNYGNVITVHGSGSGQIVAGWSGASGAVERLYYRNKRDTSDANWSPWKTLAFTDDKPATAGTADKANSVDWSKVQNKPSSYPPSSHSHAYLPTGGGTMSGALNFANGTWNAVGDDVQIGDHNTSGSFYIQGLNGPTNIKLKKKGDTSTGAGDSATITYDGGNLIIDKTIQANLSGNASTATKAVSADKATSASSADKAAKLTTARTVSGGSDITLSFNYDGSGNSTANIGFYSCKHSIGNTNNYPFHRFAKLDANKNAWIDNSMTFLISQDYSGGGYGICRLVYRSNADSSSASLAAEWLVRKGLSVDTVQVAIKTDKTNGAYCDAFYKSSGGYMSVVIRAIASGGRASLGRTWTLINSNETDGTTATDKKTSSECWKTIADAGNELHKQAYSSSAPAINGGYVASAGLANTAASCTGNSASATKLTSSAGSATQPVYFKDGKPVAGTYTLGDASSKMVRTLSAQGNSGWTNKTTDDKYVPTMSFMAYWNGAYGGTSSNLQYCDRGRFGTIVTKGSGDYAAASHTHNYAGSGSAGGSANSAIKLDSSAGSAIQPVYFKDGKPVATTYTLNKTVPADAKFTDTDTWRGIQNNLTSDSTDQSLSAAQGKALKTLVDGKAPISHTHKKSQITDFPSSMPASDVYAWAKAATKPSYTKAEVGLGNVDNTADKNKSVNYATSAGLATNAQCLNNDDKYMKFHWSGQKGQPTWLWGGNDSGDMYVYNPSNFNVNYANSAGSATIAWNGVETSGSNYIRFKCGVQICWKANVAIDAYGSTYTFQAAFSAIPAITAIGCQDLDDVFFIRNITKTNFIGDKKGYLNGNVSWIAVGVWK